MLNKLAPTKTLGFLQPFLALELFNFFYRETQFFICVSSTVIILYGRSSTHPYRKKGSVTTMIINAILAFLGLIIGLALIVIGNRRSIVLQTVGAIVGFSGFMLGIWILIPLAFG